MPQIQHNCMDFFTFFYQKKIQEKKWFPNFLKHFNIKILQVIFLTILFRSHPLQWLLWSNKKIYQTAVTCIAVKPHRGTKCRWSQVAAELIFCVFSLLLPSSEHLNDCSSNSIDLHWKDGPKLSRSFWVFNSC